jgi:hypothetical protein
MRLRAFGLGHTRYTLTQLKRQSHNAPLLRNRPIYPHPVCHGIIVSGHTQSKIVESSESSLRNKEINLPFQKGSESPSYKPNKINGRISASGHSIRQGL